MTGIFAAASAIVVALCTVAGTGATAADYLARPVNLIVAFTPGGPSDVLARIVGRQLEKLLGQAFVIDNRPGGAGNIAAEIVARAAPDGSSPPIRACSRSSISTARRISRPSA